MVQSLSFGGAAARPNDASANAAITAASSASCAQKALLESFCTWRPPSLEGRQQSVKGRSREWLPAPHGETQQPAAPRGGFEVAGVAVVDDQRPDRMAVQQVVQPRETFQRHAP